MLRPYSYRVYDPKAIAALSTNPSIVQEFTDRSRFQTYPHLSGHTGMNYHLPWTLTLDRFC